MKRIYEEYLYVPEDGKIKEKVFILRIAVAIVCVVCCLSAMGFSAYAFFTSSITSSSNTIVAATFGAEITVAMDENDPQTKVTPTVNQTIHTYSLVKGTYHVTIKATGNAKSGYCKIVIGDVGAEDSIKYYTIQMSTDEKASENQLEFEVECYNDSAEIHIIPNWGSCSEKDDLTIGYKGNNKLITIGNPTSGTSDNESQKTPTTSDSETSSEDENPITDSEAEIPDSTEPSGEVDSSNASQDEKDSNDTIADGVSDEVSDEASDEVSNEKNDDGSSENVQDETVIQ